MTITKILQQFGIMKCVFLLGYLQPISLVRVVKGELFYVIQNVVHVKTFLDKIISQAGSV